MMELAFALIDRTCQHAGHFKSAILWAAATSLAATFAVIVCSLSFCANTHKKGMKDGWLPKATTNKLQQQPFRAIQALIDCWKSFP